QTGNISLTRRPAAIKTPHGNHIRPLISLPRRTETKCAPTAAETTIGGERYSAQSWHGAAPALALIAILAPASHRGQRSASRPRRVAWRCRAQRPKLTATIRAGGGESIFWPGLSIGQPNGVPPTIIARPPRAAPMGPWALDGARRRGAASRIRCRRPSRRLRTLEAVFRGYPIRGCV